MSFIHFLLSRIRWKRKNHQPNPKRDSHSAMMEATTFCREMGSSSDKRAGVLRQTNQIACFIYEKGRGRVTWTHEEPFSNENQEIIAIDACLGKLKERISK